MRRIPILVVALGAILATVLGLPLAAHAGGPTSVLVTSPGHSAAALYYDDSEYAELERQVSEEGEGVAPPPSLGQGLQSYNVTWLIHDQQIWRTDRVYVDSRQVFVETTMVGGIIDSAAGETATWRRLTGTSGDQLVGLLRGVLEGQKGAAAPALASSGPDPVAAPAPGAAAPGPARSVSTGWAWALPGLGLGLGAGLLVARRRNGSSPSREPRRVLLDGDSVAV